MRNWAWRLTLGGKERGDTPVRYGNGPSCTFPSWSFRPRVFFVQHSDRFLSWTGKSSSTTHRPGPGYSCSSCGLEELRNPPSLPAGVWRTQCQAANIKPTRFLVQWTDSALREKWLQSNVLCVCWSHWKAFSANLNSPNFFRHSRRILRLSLDTLHPSVLREKAFWNCQSSFVFLLRRALVPVNKIG